MSLRQALVLAVALASAPTAVARDARVVPTAVAAHEAGDVHMPVLSPDGRDVAYAVARIHRGVPVAEIRALRLANGRRRVLLPARVAADAAVYAAPALSLRWDDRRHLEVDLGDGDVGYTRYRLDGRSGRRLAEAYHEDDFLPQPDAGPAWQALVPQWPSAALTHALQGGIRHAGGALVQKAHAGEDPHVWWLEPTAGQAIPVLEQADGRSRLIGGASLGTALVFAVAGPAGIDLHLLEDARARSLARLPMPGEDAAAPAPSYVRLRPLRCTASACWLALDARRNGDWSSRLLRVSRDGTVAAVDGIGAALASADMSPDGRWLAATHRRGDGHRLVVYRVTAF